MTRFTSWLVLAVGAMLMAAAWALAETADPAGGGLAPAAAAVVRR